MTRSLLFVPGDSGRKFDHAAATTADALILDLEDSVAPDQNPPPAPKCAPCWNAAPPASRCGCASMRWTAAPRWPIWPA